jgi:hypothetical protein
MNRWLALLFVFVNITYWFGDFYTGKLDQFKMEAAWNSNPLFTLEFNGQRNIGA